MSQKVLIADDEANIVMSLEFMLKRQGYEVLIARDGTGACPFPALLADLQSALRKAGVQPRP